MRGDRRLAENARPISSANATTARAAISRSTEVPSCSNSAVISMSPSTVPDDTLHDANECPRSTSATMGARPSITSTLPLTS